VIRKKRFSFVQLSSVVVLSCLALAFATTIYARGVARQAKVDAVAEANRAVEESDRKLCEVFGLLVSENRDGGAPPTTDFGVRLRAALERVYTELHCEPSTGTQSPLPQASPTTPR